MALPSIGTLEDCADFSKVVEPFIPQLYALPEKLLDVVSGRERLLSLYAETNPLISGFAISVALGAVFLVLAEINRNYSQVDRAWSILPTLYIAHFDAWARLSGIPSQRIDTVLLVSVIWSIRLTFNYWRKGGYSVGHEDYRWEIIRGQMPKAAFHVFNWTFISFMQSILLFLIAAPVYIILLASRIEPGITSADVAYMAIELGLVLTEYIADHQQWVYQSAKRQYLASAKVPSGFEQADLDRGFIASGLWGYSRHPNFAAEQSIWFFLYQWSCYTTKTLYSWAGVGPSFLILLFQGSTWLTELITAGKYAEYVEYQRNVGMFVPTRFSSYKTPVVKPKVIRTSDLAKRQKQKQK
ncbi:Steroid 5-alpha reductase C-terminal domain-containing protein [Madurella fahalii]|uniref:Steroid 5-alpha reductase C-terminal domain-containing protein n=1 Tax=Madurella fahalii TaxID=1157608 RepID=A0ABQ0GSB5_9PEZI